MELSAVSVQHSAKDLFLLVLADSPQLMTDRAHQKTAVFGWALAKNPYQENRIQAKGFCEGRRWGQALRCKVQGGARYKAQGWTFKRIERLPGWLIS
jgi:hypothetical protein